MAVNLYAKSIFGEDTSHVQAQCPKKRLRCFCLFFTSDSYQLWFKMVEDESCANRAGKHTFCPKKLVFAKYLLTKGAVHFSCQRHCGWCSQDALANISIEKLPDGKLTGGTASRWNDGVLIPKSRSRSFFWAVVHWGRKEDSIKKKSQAKQNT